MSITVCAQKDDVHEGGKEQKHCYSFKYKFHQFLVLSFAFLLLFLFSFLFFSLCMTELDGVLKNLVW